MLSTKQFHEVARRLKGTKLGFAPLILNLYNLWPGTETPEEMQDILEAVCGIFRCEACFYWLGTEKHDSVKPWICQLCAKGPRVLGNDST